MARRKAAADAAPEAPAEVLTCRVLINNLWTTKGKFLQGEEVTIPAAEASHYDGLDKVKIVRP